MNAGLLIRPENGDWLNHMFHSREATDAGLRPRLVVSYTTSDAATVTPTPTPALTRTGGPPWTPTSTATPASSAARPWPDTSSGIHVFN